MKHGQVAWDLLSELVQAHPEISHPLGSTREGSLDAGVGAPSSTASFAPEGPQRPHRGSLPSFRSRVTLEISHASDSS